MGKPVVLVNQTTFRIVKQYASAGRAIAAVNRMSLANFDPLDHIVMTVGEYNAKNVMVTVHSLMNGAEVQIRKSDVGGCTDPSTERYWSM